MLTLSPKLKIGSGHQRHCYYHPEDVTRCIKILRDRDSAPKHQKLELYFYRRYNEIISNTYHVSGYHGEVSTNLGNGYMFELIRDAEGGISKSLRYYLMNKGVDRFLLQEELARLGSFFLNKGVIFRDFNSSNTVVQKSKDGSFRLVVIDGLGDRVSYSLINIFPALVRRKIRRRWNNEIRSLCKIAPWLDYTVVSL